MVVGKLAEEMLEFFLLGCTGVVVLLHGANFLFNALSSRFSVRHISFLGVADAPMDGKEKNL